MWNRKPVNVSLLVLMVSLVPVGALGERTIFVDVGAIGANDGSSWQNAYKYLQDALADAGSSGQTVEIRVAKGVYKPDQGAGITSGDRTATFQFKTAVAICGGYAGFGAPDPDARDIAKYETTLSGDLENNDPVPISGRHLLSHPTRQDNSYHVLMANHADETAIVDGFTVVGGNANMSDYGRGGGMYCWQARPTVRNCTFQKNSASELGGALYYCGTVSNCTVRQNYAGHGGGIHQCSEVLNCAIISNGASSRGGCRANASKF